MSIILKAINYQMQYRISGRNQNDNFNQAEDCVEVIRATSSYLNLFCHSPA